MRKVNLFVFGLVFSAATVAAQPAWPPLPPPAAAFARARLDDGRRLLLGPPAPTPSPATPELDCAALYTRRVALMQDQLDYRPAWSDDPRNQSAVFIGAVFTPGFYFLPFSGIQDYLDRDRKVRIERELDVLRAAAAARHCDVR